MPGKVRVIPANTNEPMKHVVIYARVSSNTMEQLDSLKAQISGLTKFVSGHNNWKLVDKDNFEFSDCIPLDCDNDHSDNPNEWVTPLDIALEIPGVAFAVSYSRHHNLPKGDKAYGFFGCRTGYGSCNRV